MKSLLDHRSALLLLLGMALGLGLVGGCRRAPDAASATVAPIAVTTSYLEAAVQDLLGPETAVLRLAEPGACPGHFDLRPSQAVALRDARLLLRFDFQRGLDAKLARPGQAGPRIGAVAVNGGLCRPATYLAACRQTADQLVAVGLLGKEAARARLAALEARLAALSEEVLRSVREAGLTGAPVLASIRQQDFCAWLGLRVAGTFRSADTARIREIEQALAAGRRARVRFVVANRPEGRRTADALAERLGARVVVFENFPRPERGRVSFDSMVRANVRALLAAGS